jgi:hypothetical protein
MRGSKKQEIITFKVDAALAEALKTVPNRSEFIRSAVMRALKNRCPLCQGKGILTLEQRNHWRSFVSHHSVEKCAQCNAVHLVCNTDAGNKAAH